MVGNLNALEYSIQLNFNQRKETHIENFVGISLLVITNIYKTMLQKRELTPQQLAIDSHLNFCLLTFNSEQI